MLIEFDHAKSDKNQRERGLSFERADEFDFETAVYLIDDRRDYGEIRWIAIGYLDDRLHILCFVYIPDGIRVISFRKANSREARKHGKSLTLD
ncbi:BrnT family toxin [Methylomonas sp. MK1]|uniref:BrnT family toxin n=1 Tax=Methylomonas sp. MK1 TaxID=1131552 RepID=UPI000366137E|nr:BrnT family toxin [Methylomonas sp. MK1]